PAGDASEEGVYLVVEGGGHVGLLR
ncbi:hypothetical protein LCGC14_3108810, partial [marine sediment metagenome]